MVRKALIAALTAALVLSVPACGDAAKNTNESREAEVLAADDTSADEKSPDREKATTGDKGESTQDTEEEGTAQYMIYLFCVSEFELKDDILTVSSENVTDISYDGEPVQLEDYLFSISYPVAWNCVWETVHFDSAGSSFTDGSDFEETALCIDHDRNSFLHQYDTDSPVELNSPELLYGTLSVTVENDRITDVRTLYMDRPAGRHG